MANANEQHVGRVVEHAGRTWTITQFDDLSDTPLAKANQNEMGYVGFAVAVSVPTGRQRRTYESMFRIKADGSFDRAF